MFDKLDDLGLTDNTVVIFSSDNGPEDIALYEIASNSGVGSPGPFRGRKRSIYEGGIRMPFIVRWPGKVAAGRRTNALQSLVDLPQTFLSIAGIEAPRTMTGVDQSAVWRGDEEGARDHVVIENRHQPTTIHVKTRVDERYKITVYRDHDYGELFDLLHDPNELDNLWDDPAKSELKGRLLLRFMQSEIQREPTRMPRIAGA